ncbi:hypothetical protein CKO50_07690 [Pseudoalteromonas sp. HM-SA03]|nr:hypothetical protein CKO50_07690 [Pseudoalteromonas sp. HM-SA03]
MKLDKKQAAGKFCSLWQYFTKANAGVEADKASIDVRNGPLLVALKLTSLKFKVLIFKFFVALSLVRHGCHFIPDYSHK